MTEPLDDRERKGRETVTGPISPGAGGETGERGEEQDTANWLEGITLEGERHTKERKSQVDIQQITAA
jgi:hypothetical protein